MDKQLIITQLTSGLYDNRLEDIYVDASMLEYQRQRYVNAINSYTDIYGNDDIEIYSAPGRTEIGGNHTDHQHGQVLAAAVNLDTIAVVSKTDNNIIRVSSQGYDEVIIDLKNNTLEPDSQETGTTRALIKGVLGGMKDKGYRVGGFNAYITSDVLIGAGLSSSAAFETLIGAVISGLYNDMVISPIDIAIIGQYAENHYFGKPCGLMDQMASSVGNMVHIDFANPKKPVIEKIDYNMATSGYCLCITDTKGSHADLTSEYTAVPAEMKAVANYFGQQVLLGITEKQLLESINDIRQKHGDRAVLRALHFIGENHRVEQEVDALKKGDFKSFLKMVKESGDSSYKYLQNIYSNGDVAHQNVSIALAFSDSYLGENGISRVHGGGFAGTIQAFVMEEVAQGYMKHMENIFGAGASTQLNIRKYGGIRVL